MSFADLKQQLYPFQWALRLRSVFRWPAMTRKEVRILKRIFLSFPKEQTINIFEYGMGFSTIYFAKFLHKSGYRFHVHSVDNHAFWYNKIKTLLCAQPWGKHITLHLREFTPFWEKPFWNWNTPPSCEAFAPKTLAELEYIQLPQTLEIPFNVILVDGRFRRRCLKIALKAVDHRGIVVMHDAQKKHYQPATEEYRYSRFLNSGKYYPFARKDFQLWVGSLMNPLVDTIAMEFS